MPSLQISNLSSLGIIWIASKTMFKQVTDNHPSPNSKILLGAHFDYAHRDRGARLSDCSELGRIKRKSALPQFYHGDFPACPTFNGKSIFSTRHSIFQTDTHLKINYAEKYPVDHRESAYLFWYDNRTLI